MKKVKCEWCAQIAKWKLVCGPEYRRFACDEHLGKTQRLVNLDGYKYITTVGASGGFAQ